MRRRVNHLAEIPVPMFRRGLARRMRARPKPPGTMNKAEAAYSMWLTVDGDVVWCGFECWTCRLPGGVRYTPDFIVQVKMAASTYPQFGWKIVWQDKWTGWKERVIEPSDSGTVTAR